MIRGGHRRLARSFKLCCRYTDDLIVFNNKKFLDYLKEIYPSQMTVEKANKIKSPGRLQSVSWILAEFYFNRGLQRLYTGTCIILQKTINGFLCLLIVFLKSKTYQLILKDVIKLNRNLR